MPIPGNAMPPPPSFFIRSAMLLGFSSSDVVLGLDSSAASLSSPESETPPEERAPAEDRASVPSDSRELDVAREPGVLRLVLGGPFARLSVRCCRSPLARDGVEGVA